jgi:hypothetical protein
VFKTVIVPAVPLIIPDVLVPLFVNVVEFIFILVSEFVDKFS